MHFYAMFELHVYALKYGIHPKIGSLDLHLDRAIHKCMVNCRSAVGFYLYVQVVRLFSFFIVL